jgi:hypothetical protein
MRRVRRWEIGGAAERDAKIGGDFSSCICPAAALSPRPGLQSRYSPITAADEKIALPVVHVNNKPQYVVFPLRIPHHRSKHGHLAVESSKQPCTTRVFSLVMHQNLCNRELLAARRFTHRG